MPLRPPDPGSFEHLLEAVQVPADSLLRLSKFPASAPWWSRGAHRFDGPPAGAPGSFGTCYAAQNLSVAFAESVIHECAWFRAGRYELPKAALEARHTVKLKHPARRMLVLANLSGDAPKRLGLNNDFSAGDEYALPMAWARAIHDADSTWDGLWHVSRQHNNDCAVALFERSGVVSTRTHKLTVKELDALCDQFGVVAV